MRKFWILLFVATLAAPSAGCCGRIRNLFHRGAPCGTQAVAPAVLGGPLTVPNAVVSGPVVSNGVCEPCVPCDPCVSCDPCASVGYGGVQCLDGPSLGGWSGGFVDGSSACADCNQGAIVGESTGAMEIAPRPIPENR